MSDRAEYMQELIDKRNDEIIELKKEVEHWKQMHKEDHDCLTETTSRLVESLKEIERINTAFKRKVQNIETRYNAMIHKRDREIDRLKPALKYSLSLNENLNGHMGDEKEKVSTLWELIK